jgi:hypothetical protein
MAFTFSSMVWFSIINYYREKKKIPCFIRYLSRKFKNLLKYFRKNKNDDLSIEIGNLVILIKYKYALR